MRSYRFFLEILSLVRLILTTTKVVLVDFDFTLAIHQKSDAKIGWNLESSVVNEKLMNSLRNDEFFVFTARGYRSYLAVSKWLDRFDIRTKGVICVGSTTGKIKTVERLLKVTRKQVIWYDDLADVNYDLSIAKSYRLNIDSDRLNFNRV